MSHRMQRAYVWDAVWRWDRVKRGETWAFSLLTVTSTSAAWPGATLSHSVLAAGLEAEGQRSYMEHKGSQQHHGDGLRGGGESQGSDEDSRVHTEPTQEGSNLVIMEKTTEWEPLIFFNFIYQLWLCFKQSNKLAFSSLFWLFLQNVFAEMWSNWPGTHPHSQACILVVGQVPFVSLFNTSTVLCNAYSNISTGY